MAMMNSFLPGSAIEGMGPVSRHQGNTPPAHTPALASLIGLSGMGKPAQQRGPSLSDLAAGLSARIAQAPGGGRQLLQQENVPTVTPDGLGNPQAALHMALLRRMMQTGAVQQMPSLATLSRGIG